MTTAHHSPLAFGGKLNAADMEAPLGQLDAAIAAVIATGSGASTTLTAQALAGQASLTVANSASFQVSQVVYIGKSGGTFESKAIATIPNGTTITLTANLANTYASGDPVTASPIEVVDGRGGKATLGTRLALIEGRVFDPLASPYNAVGDNTTDDRAAIQAAIDAAETAGGGTVLLTKLFRIGAELVAKSKVSIVGNGRGSGLTAPVGTPISLIHGTGVTDVTVANMTLDANQAARGGAAGADAVTFDGASVNCAVRDCIITQTARDGISFRGTSRGCSAIGNVLTLCREDGIGMQAGEGHRILGNYIFSTWGDAIFIKGTVRSVVEGNVCDTPGTGGLPSAGVSIGADGSLNNDYHVIKGNTVRNVQSAGASLYIGLGHGVSVLGNTIEDGTGIGIHISNTADSVIEGNTIDGAVSYGIQVGGATVSPDRNIIAGNVIRGSTGLASIEITNGFRNKIIGNSISGGTNRGISSLQADTIIEGNTIEGVTGAVEPGIRVSGADSVCRGNRIIAVPGSGVWCTGARTVIEGNVINGSGQRGIFVDGVNDGVIANNITRDNTLEGILVNNGLNWAVSGNRSFGTPQTYGIRSLGTSDFLAVVGNVAKGNVTSSVTLVGAGNVNASNVV